MDNVSWTYHLIGISLKCTTRAHLLVVFRVVAGFAHALAGIVYHGHKDGTASVLSVQRLLTFSLQRLAVIDATLHHDAGTGQS